MKKPVKKKSITTPARITGGVLSLVNQVQYRRALSTLPDGEYDVLIAPKLDVRSLKANAYYWGVVLKTFSEENGNHPDELHELFKKQFLPQQTKKILISDPNGEVVMEGEIPVETTTTLTPEQFSDYISRIKQTAAEIGIVIEDGDEEHMFKERKQRRAA